MISLYAQFDGEAIHLAGPHNLRPGDRLIITVLPQDDTQTDLDEWHDFSAAGLAQAYGDDEPEYTLANIRERNPDYAGG